MPPLPLQNIGPTLEDKFDPIAGKIQPSLRADLSSRLSVAVEAHLALDPDAHSPPRVEKMHANYLAVEKQRRVVWGAEPERQKSVFQDIGGWSKPEDGPYTGGVRTDLTDIELPATMFEG